MARKTCVWWQLAQRWCLSILAAETSWFSCLWQVGQALGARLGAWGEWQVAQEAFLCGATDRASWLACGLWQVAHSLVSCLDWCGLWQVVHSLCLCPPFLRWHVKHTVCSLRVTWGLWQLTQSECFPDSHDASMFVWSSWHFLQPSMFALNSCGLWHCAQRSWATARVFFCSACFSWHLLHTVISFARGLCAVWQVSQVNSFGR